ncbi:MAG: DUF1576 domain-containing protein [Christensenellales bacterium]
MFFLLLGLLFTGLAFVCSPPSQILSGSIKLLTSPANLLTDYIQLSGMGAAFFNVGVMTLSSLALVRLNKAEINGNLASAIFTLAGFSFFGKNLFNSIPITFGVFLYAKLEGEPFRKYILYALFGTALGPLVSEISFNLGLPALTGIFLGAAAGVAAGFLLPPLTEHFRKFHQGFSLYSTGFTTGIIGMFFLALLRGIGIDVVPVSIVSSGNNVQLALFLCLLFASMLLFGLAVNRWRFFGLLQLFKQTGRGAPDFMQAAGTGVILINMSLLGFLMTAYVLLWGGQLNGPTLGGIFTVVGFGAAGKHIKNVTPVLLGVLIAKFINVYDPSSPVALLAALFGTTLAPVAGTYGFFAGMAAGALHMAVTMNLAYLHGGMNLYNNGFSGGFIAAALVPVLDAVKRIRLSRRKTPPSPEEGTGQ